MTISIMCKFHTNRALLGRSNVVKVFSPIHFNATIAARLYLSLNFGLRRRFRHLLKDFEEC